MKKISAETIPMPTEEVQFVNRKDNTQYYITPYKTKGGQDKLHIQIYADMAWNDNGFAHCIADYKTTDKTLLYHLYMTSLCTDIPITKRK